MFHNSHCLPLLKAAGIERPLRVLAAARRRGLVVELFAQDDLFEGARRLGLTPKASPAATNSRHATIVTDGTGWHPDPMGDHQFRYFDGEAWTEHVADNSIPGRDPLPPPPSHETAPQNTTAISDTPPPLSGGQAPR